MTEPLLGKISLVTGASGGIGKSTALRLARLGSNVAVHYSSNKQSVDDVVTEIKSMGRTAIAIQADLNDAAAVHSLYDATVQQLGPIDVLIANAGTAKRLVLEEITLEDWDYTFNVNLRAPFLLAQKCVPHMKEAKWGRIVMVSSVAGFTGGIVGAHYASSKAGMFGLTHYLGSNLANTGITVNAVAPGLIEDTRMLPGDPGNLSSRIPVGRLGKPDEVTDAIVLFATNTGYLTNQTLLVDGGMYPH